eukprot:GHVU01068354.1.p1 GENE.GHVU01068354.1~~GHVU01068354.1.p1  ORF type:complete len:103 (+),score=14.73 GHVU01068354.1:654-962(+)
MEGSQDTGSFKQQGAVTPSPGEGSAGQLVGAESMMSHCRVTPSSQKGSLRDSLLEEVLNEKKMALMRSPEVMQVLQNLQKDQRDTRLREQSLSQHVKPEEKS